MIKRLIFYIVCLITLFNSKAMAEQSVVLPEDFAGEFTLSRAKQLESEDVKSLKVQEYGMMLWEIGRYFYEKYPDEQAFYQEDFFNELRPFFPTDSDADLQNKAITLRNIIAAYKAGRDIYDDIVSQKLVPHIYKAVHKDSEYDHDNEVSYIKAEPDEFVKVYNFKKFLSYSSNKDEIRAIDDFEKARRKDATLLDKLGYAWDKFEWKKMPYYGSKYKNPLLSELGVSELQSGKHIDVGLLTRQNYIEGNKEMLAAVHIMTDNLHFVLANNVAPNLPKLNIDLSNSQNVANAQILYPVPFYSPALPEYHKYFGNFIVPIKLTLEDVNQPLKLNAAVTATVCSAAQLCEVQTFTPQLIVEPEGDEIFANGFDNFFAVTMMQNPLPQTTKLQLKKFVIDNDEGEQSLRLEFKSGEKVRQFGVYVEEKDGYTLFAAPLISIGDDRIFVRLLPQKPLKYDLTDSEFIVSANLNNHQFIRQEIFAKPASEFDTGKPELNLGLILLAILGGLILNFMPCVFPVLSFKINALSQVSGKNRQLLRRSMWLTILGIFIGFSVIIVGLVAAKTLGFSLGWGMQYQYMPFVVVMLFVVIMMTISTNTNVLSNKFINGQNAKDIISGTLIVLLATPCTGPYLATAIGFALTGSRSDIIVLLYAVALGLCLPYMMVLSLKEPQHLFPKPGKWLYKLEIFAKIMLWLTIGWFLSLIYRQTDFLCILKLSIILLFFAFVIKIYRRYMRFLDEQFEQTIPSETDLNIRSKGKYVMMIFVLLSIVGAIFITNDAYNKNYAKHLAIRQTQVDTKMIKQKLAQGRSVLLEISADWCLTCHYNNAMVLTPKNLAYWHENYNLDFIRVDWTNYNADTLQYMARYGRKGLPFYILYTPLMREGLVLPEIFDAEDIRQMLLY